jgi:hypothetical protein
VQPTSWFDELPDEFDPTGRFPGSFDDGDPQTTNLYVANLSPNVVFCTAHALPSLYALSSYLNWCVHAMMSG